MSFLHTLPHSQRAAKQQQVCGGRLGGKAGPTFRQRARGRCDIYEHELRRSSGENNNVVHYRVRLSAVRAGGNTLLWDCRLSTSLQN
ncbi:hypothetical protein O3P69_005381 [Scylla paramamosain]|uniref:Uncharacterized protein n=1 Tax=Scylla paramamosain TaxID=85552 RepID=A0AAW0U893_SCYPA